MNYCIYNGTFIAVPSRSDELKHYGVPGMRWGQRKQQEAASVGGTSRRTFGGAPTGYGSRAPRQQTGQYQKSDRKLDRNSPEVKAARVAKAKKALKIGAAVAGTALAAYGGYKLAKYVQERRNQAAFQKAQDYVNNNVLRKYSDIKFADGTREMSFRNNAGIKNMTTRGTRGEVGKAVGQHNAQVVAKGRQMYKDATNTRLDRGLAKVVNAGDSVGNAAKRASDTVKTSAKRAGDAIKTSAKRAGDAVNKAKNNVLDVVNPKYEYTPKVSTKTWRDDNGIDWTETVTDYIKTQKKRI